MFSKSNGAAYRIRTCDVLIRSQTLYPAEVTPRKCRGYNASVIWCRSRVNFCQERSSHFCHIRCMDCDGLWPRNAFSAWWTSTDLPKRDFLTGVGCVVPYTYPPRAICMGSGGVTPRTWSGPGGSSHKRPLAGTRTYAGRFFNMREPLSIDMLKSGRVNFHLARFLFSFQPEGPAPRFRQC